MHERVLHLIVATNLNARSSRFSEMSFEDIWWMQCIMEGRMPNLGSWIIHEIIQGTTRRIPVLHFGYAISKILATLAPEILVGVTGKVPSARSHLDETTLRKMHYERTSDGSWVFRGQTVTEEDMPQDEPVEPPPVEPSVPSPHPAPSSEPIPPSSPPPVYSAPSGPFLPHPNEILQSLSEMQQGINLIGRRMTSMEDRMTSMEQNLTSFQHNMHQRAITLEMRLNNVVESQDSLRDTATYHLRGIADSLQRLGIQAPFQPPPYQPYPPRTSHPSARAPPPHYRPRAPPPPTQPSGSGSAHFDPVNLEDYQDDHDD